MISNSMIRLLKTKVTVTLGVFGFGLLGATTPVLACSCAAFPADETKAASIAFGRADVVFLGVATDVNAKFVRLPPARDTAFDVFTTWKGLSGHDQTVVRTAIDEAACGFRFRKRGWYLVFANWDRKREVLWTNMCELTRPESEAQGLIEALDALVQQE